MEKEKLKKLKRILIAAGLGSLVLFKIEDKPETQQEENQKTRPKVVYETPNHEEKDTINRIRKTKI